MRVTVILSIKPATIIFILTILASSGCKVPMGSGAASQCWNPKILRVQIGDTIFDLPKGMNLSINQRTVPGYLLINSNSPDIKTYRTNCQSKRHVPLIIPDNVMYTFDLPGRGKTYMTGRIGLYKNNATFVGHRNFIANVQDIKHIKYVGSESDANNKSMPDDPGYVPSRIYVYEHKGRRGKMECLLWDRSKFKDGTPVPPYPNNCRGLSFRMNNLIITADIPQQIRDTDNKSELMITPAEWPSQWHDIINKIADYRISRDVGGKS